MRNRMTTTDTAKATAIPTISMDHSDALKARPDFSSFSRLAPNITGMARKNVNSAATVLDMPKSKAPIIVAPERDVPGKMAAISCQIPIIKAI